MKRGLILAGNWKMNMGPAETGIFLKELQVGLETYAQGKEAIQSGKITVLFFPPFVSLGTAASLREEQSEVLWDFGAQNCHWEASGAFTGEVSPGMLLETGCHYVIIGHSERRHIFGEPDAFMKEKVRAALKSGLQPILCVGETLEERDAGDAFKVIDRQLSAALEGLSSDQIEQVVVAYEPVWAIGTGKTASDTDAQEVCSHIRTVIADRFGKETAEQTPILYGGSVKPQNTKGLLGQPDIDGALIGGASLKVDSFMGILKASLEI